MTGIINMTGIITEPNEYDTSKYDFPLASEATEDALSKSAIATAGVSLPNAPSDNNLQLLGEDADDDADDSDSFQDPKKPDAVAAVVVQAAGNGNVDEEEGKKMMVTKDSVMDEYCDDNTKQFLHISDKEDTTTLQPGGKKKRSEALDSGLTKLFGDDYNINEAKFILFACCLIALNSGFVNAACLSGLLIKPETVSDANPYNPSSHMVAGFAGSYTNNSIGLADGNWTKYAYNLWILLSYMFGSFVAAMICPHAKPFVIEPNYGPTFWIGGTALMLASILAAAGKSSRYIFMLVVFSNGIQNGIASIYSANLIRCTLSGATTDIAIVMAQMINGNYKGTAKGSVLGLICFFFWFGGVIGFYGVRAFTSRTLFINAIVFYLCGLVLVTYVMREFDVTFYGAVTGTWKWKQVLKKLDTGDGDLTKEKLMQIFDNIDADGDGSGDLDCDELIFGLKKAGVKMRPYEMNALFRAADDDGDGMVTRDEWRALAEKIL